MDEAHKEEDLVKLHLNLMKIAEVSKTIGNASFTSESHLKDLTGFSLKDPREDHCCEI